MNHGPQCVECARYFVDEHRLDLHEKRTGHNASVFNCSAICPGAPIAHHELDCPEYATRAAARLRLMTNKLGGAAYATATRLDYLTEILETAEQLRAEYVERARAEGMSWREVGESIGLTKQAAQQRYGSRPAVPAGDPHQTMIPL